MLVTLVQPNYGNVQHLNNVFETPVGNTQFKDKTDPKQWLVMRLCSLLACMCSTFIQIRLGVQYI